MRRLILLLIIIFKVLTSYSQVMVISSNNDGHVYLGLPNSIYVIHGTYSCKKLIVQTENGEIEQSKECEYNWIPKFSGKGTISVYGISGKDTVSLGSKVYMVTALKYKFQIYSTDSGMLSIEKLRALNSPMIIPDFQGDIYGVTPSLKNYSILVSRGDSVLFTINNTGKDFLHETKKLFQALKPLDLLTFYNINCYLANGKLIKIEPVEFILTY